MLLYRRFLDGVPEYLARYYWWAYLWKYSIWFFDHQPIINAILFGQYQGLLDKTLQQTDIRSGIRTLQLTCVYGKLTPALMQATGQELFLCDVAEGQLDLARKKTEHLERQCHLARMNAECLGYRNDTFDQVIVFFLFHEMPSEARSNTLAEIARVIRPGGTILVTEYAETPSYHPLYRFTPFRWLLGHLEPFLPSFWRQDLRSTLETALKAFHKGIASEKSDYCFANFYRVTSFHIKEKGRNISCGPSERCTYSTI